MNIYVGNLAHQATEDDLQKTFESFGQVTSIKIIKDRYTSESKGFGFIEMDAEQEATSAIEDLNGTDLMGKTIAVNMAKPRSDSRSNGQRNNVRQNRY